MGIALLRPVLRRSQTLRELVSGGEMEEKEKQKDMGTIKRDSR